ncbi:GNAT family N-acetyltransferase [Demequina litorisediminis]|uniref:N-acetyltransferase domain-containing protein n=1 Tax=Demequina litorisediminis TaxID=1849022 RepID=A0ABQ6ICU3_9MICO|nr:GNAT family N-acetyltransferase [Demequina litorisediminis]GMA35605.1 hypothetical protein GCM10025876_18090 [Demequina litorisediminis]
MSKRDDPVNGEFVLHEVSPESPLFEQTVALADSNREFLGIMSRVAWRDYAARRGLIAATASTPGGGERVVGLVSFRRGKHRAALAHLAVANEARDRGLARLLVGEVARRTEDLSGVLVRCRRDFPARELWPKLDFVPRGEQPGRGKEPHIITWWWLDHGHPDLFALDETSASGVPVVLDANVFIDLYSDDANADALLTQSALDEAQESGAVLMVTPELPREP